MNTMFALLVAYQLKHFLADYPGQTNRYMLGKFRADWGFVFPLLAHVGVHALGTLVIALAFGCPLPLALKLAVFDASVHFAMDRIKASPRWMGRWKPLTGPGYLEAEKTGDRKAIRGNSLFWNCLGLDQLVHHLTHYVCAWFILGAGR
jgi:hypothetical protein